MIYEKELASYGGSTYEAAEMASKIIDVSVDRVLLFFKLYKFI